VLQFLDELAIDPDTPQLIGIHLMSAHGVGAPLPEFERWTPQTRGRLAASASGAAKVRNGYDNGVLQADWFIRRIFARLEAAGVLGESLVVISADHGEGLGEHGHYGHTNHLYEEFVRVPLLIHDPGPTEYANLEYASVLDVAPTVLDVLGLSAPDTWQGRPLTRAPAGRTTFHQTTGNRPWHSILDWDPSSGWYQYLVRGEPGAPGAQEELYDLRRDRPASRNLIAREPQTAARYRALLRANLW
jgi:arylsulfatase A-like enzyme